MKLYLILQCNLKIKVMKLITMTDFVLAQQDRFKNDRFYQGQFKDSVIAYAKLLKQPLKLGMIVPCDDEGNVLKKPVMYYDEIALSNLDGLSLRIALQINEGINLYDKAKEKVLFIPTKEICYSGLFFETFKNIEDLLRINYSEFNLTESAIKQIGL